MDITSYFEDYIRRRPSNPSGYIQLAQINYKKMLERATSKEDFHTMFDAWVQFIGHRNKIPCKDGDTLLLKSLRLGH